MAKKKKKAKKVAKKKVSKAKKVAKKKAKYTARRKKVAGRVAAGVAGWYQTQVALDLSTLIGENAIQFVAASVIASSGFLVKASQRPTNWPKKGKGSKKRIDLCVRGPQGGKGWYGAVEMKWATENSDVHGVRLAIFQDAIRVVSAKTSNLNAAFVVLGGSNAAIERLFDKAHPTAASKEAARGVFDSFFVRSVGLTRELSRQTLETHFKKFEKGVPEAARPAFRGRINCRLLGLGEAQVGGKATGKVFTWQVNRVRGSTPGS